MKKTAKLRELRESADGELEAKQKALAEELFGHKMKRFTNQLENTMKIRETRREIAQTLLANRKAGKEEKAAGSTQPKENQE